MYRVIDIYGPGVNESELRITDVYRTGVNGNCEDLGFLCVIILPIILYLLGATRVPQCLTKYINKQAEGRTVTYSNK